MLSEREEYLVQQSLIVTIRDKCKKKLRELDILAGNITP